VIVLGKIAAFSSERQWPGAYGRHSSAGTAALHLAS
jgi:hypothetical protein